VSLAVGLMIGVPDHSHSAGFPLQLVFNFLCDSLHHPLGHPIGGLHHLDGIGFKGTGNFALIGPDICRKLLLDYNGLGEAYKYGGPLSSEELVVIDTKLDLYMKKKMIFD